MVEIAPFDCPSAEVSPGVKEFLASSKKMLINGEWVDAASGKTFPVYNPASGDVIAQVALLEATAQLVVLR